MEATGKIARPYAIAAYRQARDESQVAEWSAMLELLAAVTRDAQMRALIADPRVDVERLAATVIEVCGDGLSATGRNFVRLLAHNRRLALVEAMRALFTAERTRDEQRTEVRVASAFALDDNQTAAIVDAMGRRLGTAIEVTVEVDESLIGGVVINAGDLVIDASVRGQLYKLATQVG